MDDDTLANIVQQNRRLIKGEEGMAGLLERMSMMEAAVAEIRTTINSGKTVAKTLTALIAVVGIANVIVLVTLMARAAQL